METGAARDEGRRRRAEVTCAKRGFQKGTDGFEMRSPRPSRARNGRRSAAGLIKRLREENEDEKGQEPHEIHEVQQQAHGRDDLAVGKHDLPHA